MDNYEYELPEPQPITVSSDSSPPVSWIVNFSPEWKPPHFYLTIDSGEGSQEHLIVMNKVGRDIEEYFYEIGVKVLKNNVVIFDSTSRRSHLTIDCVNLLEHNCITAARELNYTHEGLIALRGHGVGWGKNGPKPTQNEIENFKLKRIGCLGYCYDIIEKGHDKSYATKDWDTINTYYIKKDKRGMRKIGNTFAKGLNQANWDCIYFLPDEKAKYDRTLYSPADCVRLEKLNSESYEVARNSGMYDAWGSSIPVTTILKNTYKNSSDPLIKYLVDRVRFGFIQTHNHSALLVDGCVFECHWDYGSTQKELLHSRYKSNNDDTFEEWRAQDSGIIMVPPRSWRP